ncbi:MAG: carboxyl transferase domain-containing protein [Myxococcota bacterium]
MDRLLIANRGEVAIRIARAAAQLGLRTVAVHSEDDARSRHVLAADEARPLRGTGAAAYLDGAQIVRAAREADCDAIHPGYGFLSEHADFARACAEAGLLFVGPGPDALALFGDKARARRLAAEQGVPLLAGTAAPTSVEDARRFLESLGPSAAIMLKAVAGGGGRGIRVVRRPEDVETAHARCASEARAAFGDGALYAERYVPRARHVEVQILGDRTGATSHLWERDCSLQRRHQKIVEMAPAPGLPDALRKRLLSAALGMAEAAGYTGVGTVEFLVDADAPPDAPEAFAFLECNPRLQVEHTITEEVTGVDLVEAQLRLAAGERLAELGLDADAVLHPTGHAVQARVLAESVGPGGEVLPATGTLTAFEPPSGPGVRVDTHGYAGYPVNAAFDPLLAKVVAHVRSGAIGDAVAKAYRALSELRIEGVDTNVGFLQSLLQRPEVADGRTYTRFVDDHVAELAQARPGGHPRRHFPLGPSAGADDGASPAPHIPAPEGTQAVGAPMLGRVAALEVSEGDDVHPGQPLAVLEAMKMEHVVEADTGGRVRAVAVAEGEQVARGQALLFLEPAESAEPRSAAPAEPVDLDHIRADLSDVCERRALGLDAARPEAVAKRRRAGQRTARENVDDLCDPGSFAEYGAFAIAAQRSRRPVQELIERTPADGLLAGLGAVNGHLFDERRARCLILAYDYTVLAGTQGAMNHKKMDRMLDLAAQQRLPVILFAEGGGGRPGDTDVPTVAGLDTPTFAKYARLSGTAPRIAIVSGRCFAGNAALAGSSDVMIATRNATLGMGGPAMIEGGGLGVYRPEEVGPVRMQEPNGVIDLVVEDEAEAVAKAKQLLGYFQGPVSEWDCADQRWLRRAVPENRLRAYDVRSVVETLADTGSVLELRPRFAPGMITAFLRIEGRPLGLLANDPKHLAGAIDAGGADKAARFMQLCDAFGLPILSLCDTPGIMVGPQAEKTGLVRHASRMFLAGANLAVPILAVVLRKGYGLGAQAMAGGSFHEPLFIVSWPTGEFGGMGLEGAVRLGFRKELEAVEDPAEREKLFQQMVELAYEHGKATNMASFLEIDDVIDPAETRSWILRGLRSTAPPGHDERPRRSFIDSW